MTYKKKPVPKAQNRKWYKPTVRDISDFVIAAGVSLGIEFLPHMESFDIADRATLVGMAGTMYGIGVSRSVGVKKGLRSGIATLKGAAFGTAVGYVLRQYTDVI